MNPFRDVSSLMGRCMTVDGRHPVKTVQWGLAAPPGAVPPWPHVLTVQLMHVGLAGCNRIDRFRILLKRFRSNSKTIFPFDRFQACPSMDLELDHFYNRLPETSPEISIKKFRIAKPQHQKMILEQNSMCFYIVIKNLYL